MIPLRNMIYTTKVVLLKTIFMNLKNSTIQTDERK